MVTQYNNIVFIGLMGAGKTTIGRQLAQHLHWPFFDSDRVVEERTGVSIPLIFELEGEQGFRKRESEVIKELSIKKNIVIATGGGAILARENRDNLIRQSLIIYLQANVEQLLERTSKDKNRPLLQTKNPKAKLLDLWQQRHPIYAEMADWTIETNGRSIHKVINGILEKL